VRKGEYSFEPRKHYGGREMTAFLKNWGRRREKQKEEEAKIEITA